MLDHCRAVDLPTRTDEFRWLIEGLWSAEAVGICGGEPKCCKSFLALDIAVAVASGRPCLRQYPVVRPGPVLLFAGEDALHEVRRRLAGIARAVGLDLGDLDIHVITVPALRLDQASHRTKLEATVAAIKPRLLVLDPFVRMHRIDENIASEVAPLLAYLRELQRAFGTSVLLVHHARKGAGHIRAGQALRGSSELHAWGDSNLYLNRRGAGLWLTVEHRTSPSLEPVPLDLVTRKDALALEIIRAPPTPPSPQPSAALRIQEALKEADGPVRVTTLRKLCKIRTQTLYEAIGELTRDGVVEKIQEGYQLTSHTTGSTASLPASL